MSVVGIDFGNLNCRVAVAHKGVVEVIANEVSNRKTPSMVAFDGRERRIGEMAATGVMSNSTNTVTEIKRLMGMRWNQPELQEDISHLMYKVGSHEDGRIYAEVSYCDSVEKFSPEQLAGSLLGCIRRITSAALDNAHVVDCVITVPPYFADIQRRAVLDAANIAGLNVLRLMNDTTAVALQYGILRTLPEKEPIRVAFMDVGHASTDVALVSFVAGKLTVLGTASDRNLGGRNFTRILAEHMAEDIASRYKGLDVRSSKKGWLRLLAAAEKAKRVLSANTLAPWSVECIVGDEDVSGTIERATFETLAAGLLDRVLSPLKQVLHASNTKLADLHAIEIVGGCVRIPAVRTLVQSYYGRACSTTCDGDESVARGAALQCAMLSPSFRVRDFEVHDVSPYAIEVGYGPADGDIEDRTVLFEPNNPMPSIKMISFHRKDAFQLVARYADPSSLSPGMNPLIGRFVVSSVPEADIGSNSSPLKTKVRIKLDLHGVLLVSSAQAVVEVEEEATQTAAAVAADTPMTDETDATGTNTAEPASEAKPDADAMETEPTPEARPDAEAKPEEEQPKPEQPKPKKKVKRVDLAVDMQLNGGLAPETFQAAFERELAMTCDDEVIVETAARRNDLESYVYEMRDKMMAELNEYMPQQNRDDFVVKLNETEEWLYTDEGWDAQKSEYVRRLDALRKESDPVVQRQYEVEHREQAIASLAELLAKYRDFATSDAEMYAHVDSAKKQVVAERCAEVETWLTQATQQQERLAKCDDVVLTVASLRAKCDELTRVAKPIMSTPRPKPAPKAKSAAEPSKEEARADDTAMATEETNADAAESEKPVEPVAAGGPAMDVD